ncbi:hypothetical protein RJT34_16606 [Clitoria ternatea]|uniref:Uncharacterized protein n=1 Tax=Clitoria ternatea TaxID=43366 RepID=A0AAN9PCG4_CLITE
MHAGLPKYVHVNLRDIEEAEFQDGEEVSLATLKEKRTIHPSRRERKLPLKYNATKTIKQARSIQELARKKFEKLLAKRSPGHTSQEPVGFDFSSGATLATIGDVLPTSHPMQGVICERPGKGLLYKFGRKPSVQDVERCATYNMSNLPITRSDSIFTTFESEIKQLVTVCIRSEF